MKLTNLFVAAATTAMMATTAMSADIFVIGGKPDDPFWSIVKRGAEDAGLVVEAQGGSVTWLGPQNYDNLGPDAAELIRAKASLIAGQYAALQGAVVGGGLELASSAHIRVMDQTAYFALPEGQRGLFTGGGADFYFPNKTLTPYSALALRILNQVRSAHAAGARSRRPCAPSPTTGRTPCRCRTRRGAAGAG